MPKYDVSLLRVPSDIAPTIWLDPNIYIYESQSLEEILHVNSGHPPATRIWFEMYRTLADAESQTNPLSSTRFPVDTDGLPTITYTDALPSGSRVSKLITLTIGVPAISSDLTRRSEFYIRANIAQEGYTPNTRNRSAFRISRVQINSHVAAEIECDALYQRYEDQDVSLTARFFLGSPAATQIRFRWYNSLSDAEAGTHPIPEADRPAVTLEHTSFTELAARKRLWWERVTINFRAPAVTENTTWYGALEILQENIQTRVVGVVDRCAFQLQLLDTRTHTVRVGNARVTEGEVFQHSATIQVGAPPALRLRHSWHANRQDARRNENALTTGIPTDFVIGQPIDDVHDQNIPMGMTMPYVTRNTTIYGRLELSRDGADKKIQVWELTIVNRVRASIDFPDDISIDEMMTEGVNGTYVLGEPPATAFRAEIYDTREDAATEFSQLTGDNNPLAIVFDPAVPDSSVNPTRAKMLEARITTPDVPDTVEFEDYGIRWEIDQPDFEDDPQAPTDSN